MLIAEKVTALMGTITPAGLETIPPARRSHLAALCRRLADLAERSTGQAQRERHEASPERQRSPVGILAELRNGQRAE